MRNIHGLVMVGAVAAAVSLTAVSYTAIASKDTATVIRGQYDFSDMVVRRVWFNTDDPVFMIDDYDRVWLDPNCNVLAEGNYEETESDGSLMAPMRELFRQIGAEYREDGDKITIVMNGDTLILEIGKKDVTLNGVKITNALSSQQVPKRVNAKENGLNPYLKEDYYVTYLPVAYVLHTFQADIYKDGNVQSFYAAVPIFKTELTADLDTAWEGYGINYRSILSGEAEINDEAVDNIIAVQNSDGGFGLLPATTDMTQEELAGRRGSLVSESTLEKGATTAELNYIADCLEEAPDEEREAALTKGIEFLLDNQNDSGGWQMNPANPSGFRANIVFTDGITTDVLRLLRRVDTSSALKTVKNTVGSERIANAVKAGDEFIINSQLVYDGKKSGWASQYNEEGQAVMGRTYERESVSAIATADIAEYLMYSCDPKGEVKEAVESAVSWLEEVKIEDKEAVSISDLSMQNGFDIFLLDGTEPGITDTSFADDGLGTWAANYVYKAGKYRPLYADVDPSRPDQPKVNDWNSKNSNDLIWYATRSTVVYYDNELADVLLEEEYPTWIETGKALGTVEEPEPTPGRDSSGSGGSSSITSDPNSGNWRQDANGWRFLLNNGTQPKSQWMQLNWNGVQSWYYFDEEGYMVTGWLEHGGNRYYLHPVSDGTKGHMYVGWHLIDDKWYYFNQESDGTKGRLLVDAVTPDGYQVGTDGVWR